MASLPHCVMIEPPLSRQIKNNLDDHQVFIEHLVYPSWSTVPILKLNVE